MTNSERFKLPVGVFIMLRQENKVLFQLRKNCAYSGFWGFVGGHLDGNEQIVSAAIREVKEEVGIDVCPEDLTLKTIYHFNKGSEYLLFFFECHKWLGTVENKEPDKCERLEWYSWDEIPKHSYPGTMDAVNKINAGVSFFEDIF